MRRSRKAPAHLIRGPQLYSSARALYPPAMTVQPTQSILIVDFGSQVTQLIARRVREAGVYSEIAPFNAAEEAFHRLQPKGIIFSGGPASVTAEDSPRAPQVLFDSGLPLLGICYGQQTLHQQLGGKVIASDQREFGRAFFDLAAPPPCLAASGGRAGKTGG